MVLVESDELGETSDSAESVTPDVWSVVGGFACSLDGETDWLVSGVKSAPVTGPDPVTGCVTVNPRLGELVAPGLKPAKN